ncbi:hypothetical protein PG991_010401 [Apiospora marii]|uniref:Uncharacterized protein n=1 Tax=Apiospora marii TaxID=335849 RepID=A0ABR1RJG8_9PEZI
MRDGLPALEGWLERWPGLSETDSQLLDDYSYRAGRHAGKIGSEIHAARRVSQTPGSRRRRPLGDAERRLVADDIRHGRLYEAEERMADAYECMSRVFLGIPDRVDKVDDIAHLK